MTGPYVDTSALAKWYLNEPRSADFNSYMQQQPEAEISRLTVVELRCLLARRRRAGDIDAKAETKAFDKFENDLRQGILTCHPLDDSHAVDALALIQRLRSHPLRTLDALHLAIAGSIAAPQIATADRTVIAAARAIGLAVARFD